MNRDPLLPWLLAPDPANPGVRYFALRDLLGRAEDDPEVREARAAIMATGPVPAILSAQHPDGYWVKPGSGYSPKYRGAVWQIIFRGIEDFIRRDRRCRTNARSRGTNMTNYSVWLRAATCRRALKRRRICKGSVPTTLCT